MINLDGLVEATANKFVWYLMFTLTGGPGSPEGPLGPSKPRGP